MILDENQRCWVVPCVPCNDPNNRWEEAPHGCCECGMMEWLVFDTEDEAVKAFKKQYPEMFDENGDYIQPK